MSKMKTRPPGFLKKEKAPELRRRKRRIRKVYEIVFGFKIWVVWDPNSRLPLAIRFATIAVDDLSFAKEVIQQAITNVGDHAKITSIAIDRGFMDGTLLWWINSEFAWGLYRIFRAVNLFLTD